MPAAKIHGRQIRARAVITAKPCRTTAVALIVRRVGTLRVAPPAARENHPAAASNSGVGDGPVVISFEIANGVARISSIRGSLGCGGHEKYSGASPLVPSTTTGFFEAIATKDNRSVSE